MADQVEPSPEPEEHDTRARFAEWMEKNAGDPASPPIAASTVILLRDSDSGPEVLMMHRTSSIAFGGAWVFPGGKLDPEDYAASGTDPGSAADAIEASRHAAVREAMEEGGITIDLDELVAHSHWMPPPVAPKRFSTWFFIAPATDEDVVVDQGEITEHAWMRPADALQKQREREIELAPPTWVTLHGLCDVSSVEEALTRSATQLVPFYATSVGRLGDDPVALWHGDAAYETGDTSLEGGRHRLIMQRGGWRFEHSS